MLQGAKKSQTGGGCCLDGKNKRKATQESHKECVEIVAVDYARFTLALWQAGFYWLCLMTARMFLDARKLEDSRNAAQLESLLSVVIWVPVCVVVVQHWQILEVFCLRNSFVCRCLRGRFIRLSSSGATFF